MTDANQKPRITDSAAPCELLDSPVCAVMSTVSPHGKPQVSVIRFERRDTSIVLFALKSSIKVRNLRLDPQTVLVVIDPVRELAPGTPAYVRLTGTAAIRKAEPEFPDHLAERYGITGGDSWELEPFVTIDLRVDRISGFGPAPTSSLFGWANPT